MSHVVKVKAECIDKSRLLSELMTNINQILESIISRENLDKLSDVQICFGSDLHSVKIWLRDIDQSIDIFETEIEEIVFDDEEVFTFFDVPIVNKKDLFDFSKVNRSSDYACVVKKNSEVLSVFESYRGANKFAKSVKADTIEVFRLYL